MPNKREIKQIDSKIKKLKEIKDQIELLTALDENYEISEQRELYKRINKTWNNPRRRPWKRPDLTYEVLSNEKKLFSLDDRGSGSNISLLKDAKEVDMNILWKDIQESIAKLESKGANVDELKKTVKEIYDGKVEEEKIKDNLSNYKSEKELNTGLPKLKRQPSVAVRIKAGLGSKRDKKIVGAGKEILLQQKIQDIMGNLMDDLSKKIDKMEESKIDEEKLVVTDVPKDENIKDKKVKLERENTTSSVNIEKQKKDNKGVTPPTV